VGEWVCANGGTPTTAPEAAGRRHARRFAGRLPGLDELRGAAILAVLFFRCVTQTTSINWFVARRQHGAQLPSRGVDR
jgi:hypothetical protein